MRTVGGRDLLGMTLSEVDAIGLALQKAGVTVSTLVSPLLRWPAPGQAASDGEAGFAFDPASCPAADAVAHAFDVAGVLRATRIRVSSYLRHDGFNPRRLVHRIERILDLANAYAVNVEVENEPECNIGSVAELAAFFTTFPAEPMPLRLKALPNLANSWLMDKPPTETDIAAIAPYVDALQLSDFDRAANRMVPLGDGDVPWGDELRRLLGNVEVAEVLASVQTHCLYNGHNEVARSVMALRRIAGEIGVTLV